MIKAAILIAEEDEYLRDLYAEVLIDEGYKVATAADGGEALLKMLQGEWDLVLLDAQLPKMDGFEVVKQLKQHPDYRKRDKRIILIFMASVDVDLEQTQGLADGIFFKSQSTPADLVQGVKQWLAKPPAREQAVAAAQPAAAPA